MSFNVIPDKSISTKTAFLYSSACHSAVVSGFPSSSIDTPGSQPATPGRGSFAALPSAGETLFFFFLARRQRGSCSVVRKDDDGVSSNDFDDDCDQTPPAPRRRCFFSAIATTTTSKGGGGGGGAMAIKAALVVIVATRARVCIRILCGEHHAVKEPLKRRILNFKTLNRRDTKRGDF